MTGTRGIATRVSIAMVCTTMRLKKPSQIQMPFAKALGGWLENGERLFLATAKAQGGI